VSRRGAAPASARPTLSAVSIGCGPSSSWVKFLAWTEDNLLRQVVYEGLREDKPAAMVQREMPDAKP